MKILHITEIDRQLFESIIEGLRTEIKELKNSFQPKQPTEYLSRNIVAEMLGVSLVTLSSWTKKGLLVSYRIGNRVLYKRHEVDAAIVKINHVD